MLTYKQGSVFWKAEKVEFLSSKLSKRNVSSLTNLPKSVVLDFGCMYILSKYKTMTWQQWWPTDSCPPIHAHFFHARSYSCPTLFMPTRTYSCRNLFMPRLIHAMKIQKQIPMDYSCQDMAKTYSCPNWFMPQRASSCLDFSCPCLFMPVLH